MTLHNPFEARELCAGPGRIIVVRRLWLGNGAIVLLRASCVSFRHSAPLCSALVGLVVAELRLRWTRGRWIRRLPCRRLRESARAVATARRERECRRAIFMGDLYFSGQGVPRDFKRALFWFRLAAAKGNVAAEYNLGVAADEGRGQPRSPGQALAWFTKAAEAGNVPAMLALARQFRTGEGVDRDLAAAARWVGKAAQTGDPQAQDELGTLYRTGKGLEPDLARAREWYQKAASQGYASAENNLGMMYRFGGGGPVDYDRALGWLYRAADQGIPAAKYNIGAMYALGLAGVKNPIEAYVWYSAAYRRRRFRHPGTSADRACDFGRGHEPGRNR